MSSATHYQGTTCADCAAAVSKGLERVIEDEDAQALAMQVFMQHDGMARTCDAVGCSRSELPHRKLQLGALGALGALEAREVLRREARTELRKSKQR